MSAETMSGGMCHDGKPHSGPLLPAEGVARWVAVCLCQRCNALFVPGVAYDYKTESRDECG